MQLWDLKRSCGGWKKSCTIKDRADVALVERQSELSQYTYAQGAGLKAKV